MSDFKYKKGYKYQLEERFEVLTNVFPEREIKTKWFTLKANGLLILEAGYAWDGPSGPAIDTDTFMIPSAVHDAGYQMIRQGFLDKSYRSTWDKEMGRIQAMDIVVEGKKKRMCWLRRWWTFRGVSWFARRAALPKNRRKTLVIELIEE